jgi:hypothetical protein
MEKQILTEDQKKDIKSKFQRYIITEAQGNLNDPNWLKVVQALKSKGFAYKQEVEKGDFYSGGLLRNWNQGRLELRAPMGYTSILFPFRYMGSDQGGERDWNKILVQISGNDPNTQVVLKNALQNGLLVQEENGLYSVPLNQSDKVIQFVDSFLNPNVKQNPA